MRSHRRRTPLRHVLLVGTTADALLLQAVLAVLPDDAYGQVIVETAPDVEPPVLQTPDRVTVHHVWPGDAGRAVAAWVEEWMPHAHDANRLVDVWISADSSAHTTARDLDVPAHQI